MIVRLFRSTLALSLAAFTVLAPVAPVSAQQQGTQQGMQQGAMPSQQQAAPPAAPQPQSPAAERTIPISNQDYARAPHWFPNILRPYQQRSVPEPVLTNTARIEQMLQDGKLRLTLQDAIELGLQNNLDIQIQRYAPWIAETQILSAEGGGAVRGSNGSSLSFDPTLTSTISRTGQSQQVVNPFLSGVSAATSNAIRSWNTSANFSYGQGFHTGTGINLTWSNSRASSSNASNLFNPAITTQLFATVTQPLLNGFGLLVNTRNIRIAKLNKSISDYQFKQQIMTSLTQVANAYWELVFARDNVGVAQHAVETADKLYSDTKKEVDIGTHAPLDLVQAEAQQATANQTLVTAKTTLSQDQLALLNLISKNAEAFRDIEIIPVDSANTAPPPVEQIPLDDAVKEAIANRPDVLQSAEQLKVDDINIKASRNALLPSLNLSAQYGAVGVSGNSNILTSSQSAGSAVVTPCTTSSNPGCPTSGFAPVTVLAQDPNNPSGPAIPVQIFLPPGTITSVTGVNKSGLGAALSTAFRGQFPDYNANITLTIPIRNRVAQAANVDAILFQRQDETRYRQVMNNAAVAVHNAQIVLTQSRVSVEAAAKTRDLDQQTLDAEVKKFQLGTSFLFNVVSDQNTLAFAQGAEVRARVNLQEAKILFDNVMGRTLQVFNITIAESKSGNVQKDTLIPGTTVTGALAGLGNGNSSDTSPVPADALAPATPKIPTKPQQDPPHR